MMRRRLLLATILAAVGLAGWTMYQIIVPLSPPDEVDVSVPRGASGREIGAMLERAGVIRSGFLFAGLARLMGQAGALQSGDYRFDAPAGMLEVLRRMARGDAILHRVTIPEGLRTDEVMRLLARRTGVPERAWREALAGLLHGRDAEGVLLPETYAYRRPARPKVLLARMMRAQNEVLQGLLPAWTDADGLRVVASIVEKETRLPAERPLVAAVIRNRLKKHLPLQMDPTVIYGLWRVDGRFSGNLHRRDLRRDTPWNTYVHKGLPPTPICNPGRASLEAAAHPADVDYLYFVADGSGGHVFASTLAEHERHVRAWVRIERQRSHGR